MVLQRVSACFPETKGAKCQPSDGCSQVQPPQQAPTTRRHSQPAAILQLHLTPSIQRPGLHLCVHPAFLILNLFSFASTPFRGEMVKPITLFAAEMSTVLETNPFPSPLFLCFLGLSYPSCDMSVYSAAGPYDVPLLPTQMQPPPPPPPLPKPEDLSPWGAQGTAPVPVLPAASPRSHRFPPGC